MAEPGEAKRSGSQTGQYLTVSISGAHRYLDQSREQIIAQVRRDLEAVFPALLGAQIKHALVIKERQATFSATPGSLAQRLPTATPVPGLYLAGAWTDTGWPATMEGAVRSGHAAAQAILTALNNASWQQVSPARHRSRAGSSGFFTGRQATLE